MHVLGLIKRSLAHVVGGAAGAHDAAAKPAAKKPTAKEIHDESTRLVIEQTRKNLAEATSTGEEGNESHDHESEDGVPLEVAAENDRGRPAENVPRSNTFSYGGDRQKKGRGATRE